MTSDPNSLEPSQNATTSPSGAARRFFPALAAATLALSCKSVFVVGALAIGLPAGARGRNCPNEKTSLLASTLPGKPLSSMCYM